MMKAEDKTKEQLIKELALLRQRIAELEVSETERRRTEEALVQAAAHWQSTFDAIEDLVMIVDRDYRVVRANEAMNKAFAGTKVLGAHCYELLHGTEGPIPSCPACQTFRSGQARHSQLCEQHLDGRWFDIHSYPIRDEDGTVQQSVHIIRDITERKRAEEEVTRHTKREEALHAIAATVSQTLDQDELLNSALEKVIEVMGVDAASVYVLDMEEKALVLKARKARYVEVIGEMQVMRLDEEEIENVLQWKDLNIPLSEVFGETSLSLIAKAAKEYEVQSLATAPFSAKGEIYGMINVASRTPRQFGPDDLELLQAIGNQIAMGIANSRLFAEASYSATVDGLTALYNHRYFHERLEEEVARVHRFGGECSLLVLDLDHFKIYNDLFGHVAGDAVLKRTGRVLCDYTRQVDIACRYGGEEFAVILPQTGPADAYEAGERLRQAVETALSLESGTVSTPLTISLGVASCPGDGLSREELVRSADRALGEAKERGRNQTCSASDVPSAGPAEGEVSWEVAEHLEAASLNTIYALAAAVDARDHYTYGHSRNVSRYAVAMGKALDLSRRKLERLRIAALLHDIGKIGLSDSIIRKPGPLDEAQWETMRKHSELGATIISHTPELANCAPAIRHHHEWYDGSGYPDGLKDEAIPLEARIIAIADAYDTMTTPRAYRQMAPPWEAIEELRLCAGTQFDPHLVETFVQANSKGVRGKS